MEATNKARDTAGEFLVVWQNYKAQGPDELTLHEGDVVELLDTIDPSVPTKKQKLDPELDAISGEILNTSAARHKLSVKPRRTYASSRHSPSRLNLDARWLVREVKGSHKEGWVPCQILQTADEPVPGTGLPGDAVYRRQAVVKELVETEQEFVKDLDYVVQNYLIRSETAKVPKILKDNFDLIFGNLKQIANFHSTVLMEGVKYYANEPHLLGKAFLRLERDFDKHVSYCSDEPQVQMFLDSCDEARDYFDELSQRLGDDKSLSEHLKLPIQRINDYQLLLKELVRYSACLGEEHSDLQKALELMLSIPNRAEDDKFINSIEGYRGSIHKLGRLLAHDWFSVQFDKVTKERYLFLFKARILICKVRRISEDRSVFQLKDIIRLPQVEIKDHPDDRVFELIDKTVGHSLILTAHRDHVKEYWVKEIKEFASEAVDIEESGSDDFQLATPPTESSQPTQPEERAKLIEKSVASQEIKQSKVIIVQESEIKEQKHTEISKSKTVSTTSQQSESKKTSQQSNVNIQPNNKEETSNPTKRPESSTVTQNPSSNPSKPTETQNPPAASSSPKPPEKLPPNPAKPVTQNPLIPTEVPKQSEFLFKPDTENPTDRDTALKKVYSVEKVPAIASEVQVSDYSVGVEVNVEVAEDMSRKYSALSSTAKSEGYESSYSRRSVLHSSDGVSRYATESSVSNKYGTGSDSLSNRYSTDLGSKYGIESSVSTSKYEELANKYGRSLSQSSDHDVIGKYGDTSSYSRKSLVGGGDDDAYSYSKRTVRSVHVKDDDDDSYTSRRSIKERRSLIDTDDDYNFSRRSIKDRKKLGDEEDSYSYARRSIKSVRAEESGDGELNYTKRSVHISREGKSEDDYGDSYSYRKFSIGDDNSETKKRYVKRSISKTSDDEENKYIKRSISRTSDEGEGKYNRQHSGNLMEYDDESSYSRRSVRNRERKGSRTYSIDKSDSGNSQSEMVSVKKVTEESVINGKEVKKEEKVLETDSISLTMKTSKEENISAVVDDKSVFTKHIRGTNIEPGESATFEVALAEKPESLIWLKDNKAINGNGSMSGRISSTVLEKNNEYHLLLKQVDHSDAGLYTAVATYPHGKATCSAQLVVHELSPEERRERAQTDKPEFLVQLKDTELLESTYLRFMVKVIGDPNPEIAFFKDGVKVPENSERIQVIKEHSDKGFYELVIPDVKHSDAGQYKCVASNKFGEASSEATVTVTDSKNIFDDLNTDEILQPGEKINFSWKKDGQPFEPEERFKVLMGDDEDSLALVFQHVRPEDVGLYTCVAQTSRGHISCSAELTVHGTVNQLFREPEKPILVIEKREAIVTAGGSAMLELQCKGYPKPDVKWKHEGKPIEPSGKYKFLYEDEESMSLVIKDVQPSDSGKYEIIAENELGKDTSDITLTVKAPPKIKNKMEDVSISADMELKMTVEIEGTPKPTVQFYKDGQEVKQSDRIKIVSEGEKHTLIINKTTLKDSGSYSVVATNELAQVSQFWKLNVFTKPKILQKLGSDKQVSQNEQVQLKVQIESEPAPEVSWFKDDQEISSSEHYVISKDGDSYMLRISGAVTTDSAKYKFKAMNIHGTVEDDVRVDVKRGPTITKPLEDMTVTEHDTNVTFDVKVEAFPKPTVKWFLDEVEISETRSEFSRQISDDGAKLVIKEVTSELSGKYTCKVVNELGATECSAKLTVNCKPRIIKHLKDTTVDEGATLYLEVEVDACPEPTVKWLRNGREVSADARIKISRDKQRNETYNLAVDLIKYEEQGEYEVIITNALGTVTSKSNVTVHKVTLIDQLEEDEANIVQTPLKQEIVEIEDDSKKGVSSDKFEIEEILEEPPIQAEQKEFEQPEINQGTLYEKVDIEEKQMKCKSPEPLVEEPMSPNIPQTSKLSTKEKAEIVELDESDKAHPVVEKDIPRRRPSRGKSVQFETIEEIENIVELKTPTEQELPRKNSLKAVSAIKEEVEVHDASSEPNIAIESDVVEEKSQKGISAQKESAEMVESDFDSHKKKKSEEKIVRQESQKGVKDFVEEDDEELESLLRRAQKQRSLVEDISIKEIVNDEAIPTISDSNMKDDSRPASLDKHFIVRGTANPPPVATWYLNGKEIKPDSHLRMTASQNGDEYRLDIVRLEEKDAGVYECRLGNLLGEAKQQAKLEVTPEKDLRRPKLKEGLIDQTIVKKNTVTMFAVIIGDPIPDVTWSFNGKEITMEEFEKYKIIIETEDHDIEDGLKECKFSLTIPRCERVNGGQYSIKAKNKWGECDSSAQLTIILRPEIEGPADVAVVPGEPIQFTCKIQSNPLPSVTWSKDDKVIEASDAIEIIEDTANETYTLKFHKVLLGDEGYYKVTAKNHLGEDSSEARLKAIKEQEPSTEKPKFITGLTDNPVEDGGEISVMVRADGLPKPEIHWYFNGNKLIEDENHKIEGHTETQVTSTLTITNYKENDIGIYKAVAVNVVGEAETNGRISMLQTPPSFGIKLERSEEVNEGEPLELKAKIHGSPKPKVAWYKDGEEISPDDEHIKTTLLPDGTVKLNIDKVLPEDSGAYKLVVRNPNGETAGLCAVAVNQKPQRPKFIKCIKDTKATLGEPFRLEAQVLAYPPPEIKWLKDGLPIRGSSNVHFENHPDGRIALVVDCAKPETAGNYQLIVSNKLGENTGEAKVEIEKKPTKPEFILKLKPMTVVEGFPVKFEVKADGFPAPKISWIRNGAEVVSDKKHVKITELPDGTSVLVLDACDQVRDALTYKAVASNEAGEATTSAPLTVTPASIEDQPEEKPLFLHSLKDVITDEGQPLILEAPFNGNPIPSVEWTKDGVPLQPSDRILLTCDGKRVGLSIDNALPSDAGKYGVTIINPLGKDSTEAKAIVHKVYQPPTFTQRFTDLQQLPNRDAKFPARVSGVPQPEVAWSKDGVPITESDKYRIKRDGDACCLYINNCEPSDAGVYRATATNKEGEDVCTASLEVVEEIKMPQKIEPPVFLKRIGDTELFKGMTAKFTACASGHPEPNVEWFKDDQKLFPSNRIKMEMDRAGLLRLTIAGVDVDDVGKYSCKISNEHGSDICHANLRFDAMDTKKRPIQDQYIEYDKYKRSGAPVPLSDPPIISRMTDRHCTLSWKPSIPSGPRAPVTYQLEMCELPNGDWFTVRSGIRSCTCGVRNLEPFRDYKFRVRVENKYGISEPSPYAITHREKLEPEPPKFMPYLEPGIDFRPETSPYFPKDFDIDRPPHDNMAQAPRFLRQEHDTQYGVKDQNTNLFWFVYGYPKPKMTYYFNDELIESGGRFDMSYTRNGQATLFINKMLDRDVGWYEAVAKNEHGEARQRVRLEIAELPTFIKRPDIEYVMVRGRAHFVARIVGVPYPEIKWYKDWKPLAASSRIKIIFKEPDTTELIINEIILKDEGLYSVSARNVAGSASSSAMLHIEENDLEYNIRTYSNLTPIKSKKRLYTDLYDIGDELGRGTQGVTYHAVERMNGRNYAAKIMHGRGELRPFMYNELDILNQLRHRKLISLHDAYESDDSLALILELASGGELVRDYLIKQDYYTEGEIAGYIRQLLQGLEYMHERGFGHMGLNIGDLLLSHPGGDDLKIGDFGLARRITMGRLYSLNYGVPEYVSPEAANGQGTGLAHDMWSVGIITYILLSGYSPFRGKDDRETLMNIQGGKWSFDESWWSKLSFEARDFITKLLVYQAEGRMDVHTALRHPWLERADKQYSDEYRISSKYLSDYFSLYREWYDNASCKRWFRRRPLEGAFTHPSRMVYPPGDYYTPPSTPAPEPTPRKRTSWEDQIPNRSPLNYEIGLIKSESHYQNGPDTYLLQLRDVDFPVRLREYMKVAANRGPGSGYIVSDENGFDWQTPVIRERRRFTDVMDEEIDDERKARISKYGTGDIGYTTRRLRHELGSRLDTYVEAEAFLESKQDGRLPFFREKPQLTPLVEGKDLVLSCFAVGEPKPLVQWFKNDAILAESHRIKIETDDEGRSHLKLKPALGFDIGMYKVVARNKVGQTVARTRIVLGQVPDEPDSPQATEVSDTEVLLTWKQPKFDGHSPVLCYSLEYKLADDLEWTKKANNIDHEFYLISGLEPNRSYIFRLAAYNAIGWSEQGVPSAVVNTKDSGAPKIHLSKAMSHLQQLTDSGHEVEPETITRLNYTEESNPIEWSDQNIHEKYNFISEISRGRFSTVLKAVDKSNDKVVVAKCLELTDHNDDVEGEFAALRSLRHERIAGLLAAFRSSDSPVAIFILEKLQGSDIVTYLASRHEYTEQTVATVVAQILDALQYLHWRGLCHLDVQPDNVVMCGIRSIQVKLVDLGSAHRVTKLGNNVPVVGHYDYISPEVLSEEPAFPQSDIWSVGVLTYVLLSGTAPFKGEDENESRQNILFVRYRFEHLYKELSQEATRFLMLVFKRHPNKRPTAEECHENRWLLPTDYMIKKRERAVFLGNRLKEYSDQYHAEKKDSSQNAAEKIGIRGLIRSHSIQEELLTAP